MVECLRHKPLGRYWMLWSTIAAVNDWGRDKGRRKSFLCLEPPSVPFGSLFNFPWREPADFLASQAHLSIQKRQARRQVIID